MSNIIANRISNLVWSQIGQNPRAKKVLSAGANFIAKQFEGPYFTRLTRFSHWSLVPEIERISSGAEITFKLSGYRQWVVIKEDTDKEEKRSVSFEEVSFLKVLPSDTEIAVEITSQMSGAQISSVLRNACREVVQKEKDHLEAIFQRLEDESFTKKLEALEELEKYFPKAQNKKIQREILRKVCKRLLLDENRLVIIEAARIIGNLSLYFSDDYKLRKAQDKLVGNKEFSVEVTDEIIKAIQEANLRIQARWLINNEKNGFFSKLPSKLKYIYHLFTIRQVRFELGRQKAVFGVFLADSILLINKLLDDEDSRIRIRTQNIVEEFEIKEFFDKLLLKFIDEETSALEKANIFAVLDKIGDRRNLSKLNEAREKTADEGIIELIDKLILKIT